MFKRSLYTIDDLFQPDSLVAIKTPTFKSTPDFQNTYESGVALTSIRDNRTIFLPPGGRIQAAIDTLSKAGGGELNLLAGTFKVTSDIVLPSGVSIRGSRVGTIIDFDNTASQLKAVGSNGYNTGTISVSNDGIMVFGTGTSWTADMAGQSILLEDLWYEILTVNSATSLTLNGIYDGSTLANTNYVIADIVSSMLVSGITLQNSTIAGVKIQYADDITLEGVFVYNCLTGVDCDDTSFCVFDGCYIYGCTDGMTFDNSHFGSFINSNIVSCSNDGFVGNIMRNWAIEIFAFQNMGNRGMALTQVNNTGIENFSIRDCTSYGVELVTTNTGVVFSDGFVAHSGAAGIKVSSSNLNSFSLLQVEDNADDGIRFTTASDKNIVTGCTFTTNTGYGVDVESATCDNNRIGICVFEQNGLGPTHDSGTGTTIT